MIQIIKTILPSKEKPATFAASWRRGYNHKTLGSHMCLIYSWSSSLSMNLKHSRDDHWKMNASIKECWCSFVAMWLAPGTWANGSRWCQSSHKADEFSQTGLCPTLLHLGPQKGHSAKMARELPSIEIESMGGKVHAGLLQSEPGPAPSKRGKIKNYVNGGSMSDLELWFLAGEFLFGPRVGRTQRMSMR